MPPAPVPHRTRRVRGVPVSISRAASLVVAVGYLIAAVVATGGRDGRVGMLAAALLPPLSLIWFPDVIGSYVGPVGRGRSVDQETPPALIAFAGWFFLAGMPALLYLIGRSPG